MRAILDSRRGGHVTRGREAAIHLIHISEVTFPRPRGRFPSCTHRSSLTGTNCHPGGWNALGTTSFAAAHQKCISKQEADTRHETSMFKSLDRPCCKLPITPPGVLKTSVDITGCKGISWNPELNLVPSLSKPKFSTYKYAGRGWYGGTMGSTDPQVLGIVSISSEKEPLHPWNQGTPKRRRTWD